MEIVKLNLLDGVKLKRSNKHVALLNLTIYYTRKNIKKSCKNNTFKMSAPTWNLLSIYKKTWRKY